MTEAIGRRIGDYEILGALGAGGMGQVFKVRNVISDRIEAMKILLPDLAGREDLANRFQREIKLLAALNHPNIASLRTALTLGNQLVMVMEYVEGTTLAQALERGPIPASDAINYIDQVLGALSYAHKQGVIHRDIKPGNMMVTPEGTVKLMDFGIARSGPDQSLTVTGTTLGSLYYMSPEQVKGEPTDARSDLYSVGVSLYEMVTGERPFRATSDFSLMAAQVQQQPKPPVELRAELPAALNDIILTAMSKEPTQRFQSADAFRNALKSVKIAAPAAGVAMPAAAAATAMFQNASSVPTQSLPANDAYVQPLIAQTPQNVPSVMDMSRQRSSHRALYVSLGGLLVVGALVAAAFFPKGSKAGTLASISIVPGNSTANTGGSQNFVATGIFSNGTKQNVTSRVTWTSSDAGVGTVGTSMGDPEVANCLSAGSTTITASMGSISGTTVLTCVAASTPTSASAETANPTPASATPIESAGPAQTSSAPEKSVAAAPASSGPTSPGSAATAKTTTRKAAGHPSQENLGTSPVQEPGQGLVSAAETEHLQQVENEVDQLAARANAVNDAVDNLRQKQSAQGLELRSDMVSAQEMMKTYVAKAQSAIQSQDSKNAERYMKLAEPQVEKLEKFMGR
jgi:serine/threonine-protein kinase